MFISTVVIVYKGKETGARNHFKQLIQEQWKRST